MTRSVEGWTRDTQLAEQLVDVPTIVSYSSLQRIMAQKVDIPVPGRGGRNAGLQGFPREQSSTALHVSQERISERFVEQIADLPVSGGAPQGYRPGQSSSSSSHFPAGVPEDADEPAPGVFRAFPRTKKVRRPQPSRVRACPPVSAHGLGRLMRQRMRRSVRRDARRRFALLPMLWTVPTRGGRKRKRGGRRRLPKLLTHVPLVAVLVVDIGSGMCLAGYAGSVLLTLCPLRLSACPSCQASWVLSTRRTFMLWPPVVDSGSGMCMLVLLVVVLSRYVPFCCRQAQDGRHHGWYDQKDSILRAWCAHRRFGSGMCNARFAGILLLALCSFRGCQAQMLGIMAGMNLWDNYVARWSS